ncbi:unnamed protein product [Moneuplotes crassus]|uniref:Uncharacterized protein n=1 Tax=Euplotes crassus TaxID=5936 RepID=A0AAD1X650_EUPCR|nr:unnamed protein product [Moneuplotes crassus]
MKNNRRNKDSKYKKISPLKGDLIEKMIRRKNLKKQGEKHMAQHLVYQQERPPSEIGYINAASGKINADSKRCSSVLLNKKPRINNQWNKNGNNLPLLSDENEQSNTRRYFQSTGIMNRSMKSEYASSSMPGFRTPSTVDSRKVFHTKIPINYAKNVGKGLVTKLKKEINQLMQKKYELLNDIKDIEGEKPLRKNFRSERPLVSSTKSQFGAEGGILKFNNRIKINYRGSDSNIFVTPSPVDLTTKGRHKRSADSESQKASLYKIYNDKQKVDMSYYFQPQSKNSSRKKKGGYRNKLKLSRRKIKAALSDMAINPMEVDEEPSLDEITKINIQSGEDIQENTQIDDHNEDSKESLKESKLNNTTEKEDTEIDKSENPEEIPIQPPSKFQQAQETEPREETKKTPEKAQSNNKPRHFPVRHTSANKILTAKINYFKNDDLKISLQGSDPVHPQVLCKSEWDKHEMDNEKGVEYYKSRYKYLLKKNKDLRRKNNEMKKIVKIKKQDNPVIKMLKEKLEVKDGVIRRQQEEIDYLKAEMVRNSDQMKSELFISQRRVQNLEKKIIKAQSRVIGNKKGILSNSDVSSEYFMDQENVSEISLVVGKTEEKKDKTPKTAKIEAQTPPMIKRNSSSKRKTPIKKTKRKSKSRLFISKSKKV